MQSRVNDLAVDKNNNYDANDKTVVKIITSITLKATYFPIGCPED